MNNASDGGSQLAALNNRMNSLLKGKIVSQTAILNERELVVFFEDGTSLFVDAESELQLSVT